MVGLKHECAYACARFAVLSGTIPSDRVGSEGVLEYLDYLQLEVIQKWRAWLSLLVAAQTLSVC